MTCYRDKCVCRNSECRSGELTPRLTAEKPRSGFCTSEPEASEKRADAICIARQCDLRSGTQLIHHPGVAIQFARARYISRSTGGSAVRSAAYNERTAITAERTGELLLLQAP